MCPGTLAIISELQEGKEGEASESHFKELSLKHHLAYASVSLITSLFTESLFQKEDQLLKKEDASNRYLKTTISFIHTLLLLDSRYFPFIQL